LHGPSASAFENFVFGAPVLAPMLFPNLSLLCGLGLWALRDHIPAREPARSLAVEVSTSGVS
jgi:hypothetical protein